MNSKQLSQKQYQRWQRWMKLGYQCFHCHQLSDRSFFYRGMQFPVCARCTGIALGFIFFGPLAVILLPFNLYISVLCILFMIIDGWLQLKGIVISNNRRRLITGILFSYGVLSLVVYGIRII